MDIGANSYVPGIDLQVRSTEARDDANVKLHSQLDKQKYCRMPISFGGKKRMKDHLWPKPYAILKALATTKVFASGHLGIGIRFHSPIPRQQSVSKLRGNAIR